jgi:hypothetical protein
MPVQPELPGPCAFSPARIGHPGAARYREGSSFLKKRSKELLRIAASIPSKKGNFGANRNR